MNSYRVPAEDDKQFSAERFEIRSLEDEIRVDRLCNSLLQHFFRGQADIGGATPEQAGANARGADYFLREFVIADRRENIFQLAPERIRQFGGNWYIVRNLEPNMTELEMILQGVAAFYRFLAQTGRVAAEDAAAIGRICEERDFFRQRIEAFWAIRGDGFSAWNRACPLD